jgi:hypothetical protein
MERNEHMKTPANDFARLQNTIDGLERLVLESTSTQEELDPADQVQTEHAMRHIFAASAARAKLTIDASGPGRRSKSSQTSTRLVPLAVRLRELSAMLMGQPDLEPRLRAVFESSHDIDEAEMDKVIEDVGKILSQPHNERNRAMSKKIKLIKGR